MNSQNSTNDVMNIGWVIPPRQWPKAKPLGSYMANEKINLLVSMGKLMGTLIHFMPVLHFIKKPRFWFAMQLNHFLYEI